ncbi:MAG: hypothetical protein ACOZCL_01870 [Bacillota bacterium]
MEMLYKIFFKSIIKMVIALKTESRKSEYESGNTEPVVQPEAINNA